MKQEANGSVTQRIKLFDSLRGYNKFDKDFVRDMAAKTRLVNLKPDETLFSQGDTPGALYMLIEGCLQMVVESRNNRKSVVQEIRIPGEVVGLIELLAGGKRNATVVAVKKTTAALLDRQDFEELLDQYPGMQKQFLDIFFQRQKRTYLAAVLPDYFKVMDTDTFDYMESLFEWVHIKRGQMLFKKGDVGDSLYILINGLLHLVDGGDENGPPERLINIVYSGQTVGEMSLLSDEIRTNSAYAVRDCDLVKLSRTAFENISEKYPEVMVAISRILVDRLRQVSTGMIQGKKSMTIVVLPITPTARTYEFCDNLADAFSTYGPTSMYTAKRVDQLLGKRGMADITDNDPRDTDLRAWLAHVEASHAFVIYMAEYAASPWTKRSLSRADHVILLADANASPTPGKIEQELLASHNPITEPNKILILIHPDETLLPAGTGKWLETRDVQHHYHVRISNKKDFLRIARILSHRAVGLALGGGAAKGIAHIGVIRALQEAGIPIDIVAGASMGAIIGSLYAMGNDYQGMLEICKKLFIDINPFTEITLPIISMMRGKKLERMGKTAYGDSNIEDLWLNFFCVSTNLTTSRLKVHHRGLLRDAVRTSSTVPGVVSPVFKDGELYVDGGVINNLPGDIISQQCRGLMVVEVVPNLDLSIKANEIPSPWKILWSKLLPFKKSIRVPNILEIMFSTVMTGSFIAAKAVKANADLCIIPPLKEIGFLDFKKMDKAAEIGYNYTKQLLEQIDDEELLTTLQGR
jgi:predicted acylesterase/phospholipase RssA/CRP-like cAMP-binding protein